MDWEAMLSNGLTSAIDGHFSKEEAKAVARIETIKPVVETTQTPPVAVQGVLNQNMMIGGIAVNKGALGITGVILAGLVIYKAIT